MHRTICGEMVSSKNELVIANILFGLTTGRSRMLLEVIV